jgi:superfamily II RNA helicase
MILNSPIGSGQSLVALALQFRAICLGRSSSYTIPIKALANQKFLSPKHLQTRKRRDEYR